MKIYIISYVWLDQSYQEHTEIWSIFLSEENAKAELAILNNDVLQEDECKEMFGYATWRCHVSATPFEMAEYPIADA